GSGGNTGSDGDGIEGSGGEGIWRSGEDHGESSDDGGVDIARSLATSALDHTGVGTEAGIEILAVIHDMQGVVVVLPQTHQSRTALSPP
ncbi:hypothetical protein Tco_0396010, partial [Tanacetum coccineum]